MSFQKLIIEYHIHTSVDQLAPEVQSLFKLATQTLEKSYAPYSDFTVGAATSSASGKIFTGANQENGAYPMCLCAERVTLSNAIHLDGADPLQYFVIVGGALERMKNEFLSPCGACRQVLSETESRQKHPIQLFILGKKGKILEFKACKDLLPFGFEFKR
jgi:cytidine deaminase